MKRFLFVLGALFVAAVAFAQTSREDIDAHPHLAMATHSVYAGPYYFKPIADAPKGYTPFYISHYGRHGSRYETQPDYIKRVTNYFHIADSLGVLTPKGKEVMALAEKTYDTQFGHAGELTHIGFEQHKGIARRMYNHFKPVFKRGSIVNSRSSTYSRCILSMAGFNESLKECEPLIETRMAASESDQKMIRPLGPLANEYHHNIRAKVDHEWRRKLKEWASHKDISHAKSTLFTNMKPLCDVVGKSEFYILLDIYKRIAFMQNIGWHDRSLLDSIFTADERHALYVYENYRWYCIYVGTTLPDSKSYFCTMNYLVDDIVKYADLAVEGKNSASADLRFGHDYYLLGLLAVTNFNEIRTDYDYADIEKLAELWRGHRYITMASNMQFVFYRSKKNPDVLVRILHNENDVTLPIESATAPFYKWEDVRNYLNKRIASLQK